MRAFSYFQPFLQLDLRWPLTLVYDLWLHEHMKFPILYHKPSLIPIGLPTFQMRLLLHFLPILLLHLRWPLTLICDLWSYQQMRIPMLHLWPNFGWNPSKHVKVEPNVSLFSQQQQRQWSKWSLCVFLDRAGNTKMVYGLWQQEQMDNKGCAYDVDHPNPELCSI